MTDIEILQLADSCGVMAVTKHEWDGKQFNHTDDYLDGDAAALVIFARELLKKREWVGLTDGDQETIMEWLGHDVSSQVFYAIEAKLKEKNT
jgi:hypothetical protein